MRMINPTIATTITMTTTFGSLKLWLATTSAAAMLRWLVPSVNRRAKHLVVSGLRGADDASLEEIEFSSLTQVDDRGSANAA